MERHSFLKVRHGLTAASLAALTLLVPGTTARAAAEVTDGWQHSMIGNRDSMSSETPTDGWQHSEVTENLAPGRGAIDGWMTSLDVLEDRDGTQVALVTDGWLNSIVGEQARQAQPGIRLAESSPSGSSAGYVDEFALASGILNLVLMSAGAAVFLRQRHESTVV